MFIQPEINFRFSTSISGDEVIPEVVKVFVKFQNPTTKAIKGKIRVTRHSPTTRPTTTMQSTTMDMTDSSTYTAQLTTSTLNPTEWWTTATDQTDGSGDIALVTNAWYTTSTTATTSTLQSTTTTATTTTTSTTTSTTSTTTTTTTSFTSTTTTTTTTTTADISFGDDSSDSSEWLFADYSSSFDYSDGSQDSRTDLGKRKRRSVDIFGNNISNSGESQQESAITFVQTDEPDTRFFSTDIVLRQGNDLYTVPTLYKQFSYRISSTLTVYR